MTPRGVQGLVLGLALLLIASLGGALDRQAPPDLGSADTPRAPTPSGVPEIRIAPSAGRPGDPVLMEILGGPPSLVAEWGGRRLSLFRIPGGQAALVGVDLDAPPQPIAWRVSHHPAGGGTRVLASGRLVVHPFSYRTQFLSLPRSQVDLDAATLARASRERAELAAALASSRPERLWRGPFRVPLDGGQPTGGFGLRRVINGQPRSPHTGFDWAAPRGTAVLAANAGRVALVADHFFAGRLVVLDHGLDLLTLYFHLDDVGVGRDQWVARGERIGGVGATGRATGPHLHFGVALTGARVDPMALLDLPLPAETADGLPRASRPSPVGRP